VITAGFLVEDVQDDAASDCDTQDAVSWVWAAAICSDDDGFAACCDKDDEYILVAADADAAMSRAQRTRGSVEGLVAEKLDFDDADIGVDEGNDWKESP